MSGSQVLDARTFPLHGARLIEASAGTGKTWTIAALYLRLVLGHGGEHGPGRALLPPEILVMTFTRAATRELSERIRARLVEAVACFRGERGAGGDSVLQALLDDCPEGAARQEAAWRLALAAECMDEAAIHTIDAWCQRMLREHAFDSGNLFDEELDSDERQRLVEAARDYWRQHCYPLDGRELQALLQVWPGVAALVADMEKLCGEDLGTQEDEEGSAQELIGGWTAQTEATLAALAAGWQGRAQRLQDWITDQLTNNRSAWDGRKLQAGHCAVWLDALRAWAEAPHGRLAEALKKGAERLVPGGLAEALKQGANVLLPPESQALAELLQALAGLQPLAPRLRLHAAASVRRRLRWLKQQAGTYGFADMLERLDAALAGAQGEALRARILAQHPVALVDEFQDTSPLQYRLFERIWGTEGSTRDTTQGSALLLIGDPKQSIYGFRGADIHSYLRARRATAGRHYMLGTNHRSTAELVAAVNHWFAQAEQRAGDGAFRFRIGGPAGYDPLPFVPVQARGRSERFVAGGAPVPALTLACHGTGEAEALAGGALQQHLAQCCAEQIVQWLADPTAGFEDDAGGGAPPRLQRLQPGDIAVLVRTGAEAQLVRQQLERRGVPSVFLSDRQSVLASAEAADLLLWLRAVAAPQDARAARAALATRLVGLPLARLAQLAIDDEAFDAQSALLRELYGVWQRQGVLAMLRQTLHRLQLPARWLAAPGGERRLTNVLHLAELLQSASSLLEGRQALVRWLAAQLATPGGVGDEQIVRLESDADLVQVVTVHKSKGLEYPVVLLPFAAAFKPLERQRTPFVRQAGADGARRLLLDYSDEDLQQADHERLREDLRLFYVALTRARHALWLGWGPVRRGNARACTNERSASGYLLGGAAGSSAAEWREHLQALAQGCTHMRIVPAEAAAASTRLPPAAGAAPLADCPPYAGCFDRHWGVASFSSVVRSIADGAAPVQPLAAVPVLAAAPRRAAPDEPGEPEAGTPLRRAGPLAAPWHRFARGALVGNFLHEQLEWLEQEDFALSPGADCALAERLRRRCQRAGRQAQAEAAIQWLAAVLHHRLPPLSCSLAELGAGGAAHQRLAEMEFWLPLAELPTAGLDAVCRAHLLPGADRPALSHSRLQGLLMGFADLVFAHEGRYWVLDYKSNQLGADAGAYDATALAAAVLAHRYDVQAALYLLALHRLLRQRLGAAYRPEEQLGGALFFFLRGLDGPAAGVHAETAPLALLAALDALLEGAASPNRLDKELA
ncbi:exodeoxyribonuclease V subunit beta [Melaminivora sp.]|uniref:exodeoxyribonuclease V subunit beta n=1 Tax=Melaminivora sp. TaxID=1933032 RepID=UPI0028AF2BC3|nr:exodeoxyribonuclease V subunit beta [Melaminivora sp.]